MVDLTWFMPVAGLLCAGLSIWLYGQKHVGTAKGVLTICVALLLLGVFAPLWGNFSVPPAGAVPIGNHTESEFIVYKLVSTYYCYSDNTQTIISYGTDGDTVLQACLASAGNGDTITIKPATYFVDEPLVVDTSVDIEMGNYATTIRANGAISCVFKIEATNVHINGGTVDANGYANIGVWINGGARVELNRVEATNALVNDFEISYGGTQRTGNKLTECVASEAGQYGIYLGQEQTDSWITECTVKDSDYSGTDAGIAIDASGEQILNNHVWGCKYGILLAPTISTSKLTITGNYIESQTDANIYNAGTCHSALDSSIIGNVFWANQADRPEYDILLNVTNPYFSERLTITGNVFQGQAYSDTGIVLGDRARYNNVVSNTFYSFTGDFITLSGGGIYNRINFNDGYLTEAHGLAVLLNGTTSVAVTHTLSYTPYRGDITLVLSEFVDSDGAEGKFYVSAADATTFTINSHHAPSEDVSIYWSIIRVQSTAP